MPNKILNGDFSDGFTYWTKTRFTMDVARARATSSATSDAELLHTLTQEFSNIAYVLNGRLWVWGKWNVPSGELADGHCKFKIKLWDPFGGEHLIGDFTKWAGANEGWLLENEDITPYFGLYGNFTLELICSPASAKSDDQAGVSNPYTDWTKSAGLIMYESNNKIKAVSYSDKGLTYEGSAEKSFVVDAGAYDAHITVKVKGYKPPLAGAKANGKVLLVKPGGGTDTLWSGGYSDNVWHTILNNADITDHITGAGTYKLRVTMEVASGWDGEWVESEFHFGDCSLTAKWYTYEQARGWYDDISLNLLCRYTKAVKEDIGSGELKLPRALIGDKESLALGESYAMQKFKGKLVSEGLGVQESVFKKVFKLVKEDLGFSESFLAPDFVKTIAEVFGLSESYIAQRRVPRMVAEGAGVHEHLTARRTMGNVVITYDLTTKTGWTTIPGVTTPWIKTKTEV